jgi:hypothetical protein
MRQSRQRLTLPARHFVRFANVSILHLRHGVTLKWSGRTVGPVADIMYTFVLKTSAAATRSKAIEARRRISKGRDGRNPGTEATGVLYGPEAAREVKKPRNGGMSVVPPVPWNNSAASPKRRQSKNRRYEPEPDSRAGVLKS